MSRQVDKPEGKKQKAAPIRQKRGKVINRGHNPQRDKTYFTNASGGASVTRDSHNPHSRGDAGWGIQRRSPTHAVFRRQYTEVNGVRKLVTLAVPVGQRVSHTMRVAMGLDEDGSDVGVPK
jgi:hypothetical protein